MATHEEKGKEHYMNIRKALKTLLEEALDNKITSTQALIQSAREGQQGETKSSAGDKHETARAMAHLEQEKNAKQLQQQLQLKALLHRLPNEKSEDNIVFGDLVTTNQANYFLAIPFGKLTLKGKDYFVISVNSPVGQELLNKRVGDTITFNGQTSIIESVD